MTRLSRALLLCASVVLTVVMAMLVACSSSTTPAMMEMQPTDSGAVGVGDGNMNGASPEQLYGACMVKGSFGSTCTAAESGADPTDCTDPSYSECFLGGQGAWCTKACKTTTDCTTGGEDAGCQPTACNMKGYCK